MDQNDLCAAHSSVLRQRDNLVKPAGEHCPADIAHVWIIMGDVVDNMEMRQRGERSREIKHVGCVGKGAEGKYGENKVFRIHSVSIYE